MHMTRAIPFACLLQASAMGCSAAPSVMDRDNPPPPKTVVPVPSPSATAASSGSPAAPVQASQDSPYTVLLRSKLVYPKVHVLSSCLVVTSGVGGDQAPRRAFVLNRDGLVEEPRLEKGVSPRGPVIRLTGDWPRQAVVELDSSPGGYACSKKLAWSSKGWQPIECPGGCCDRMPDSFVPGSDAYVAFSTPWTRGRVLYEMFDPATRESTFFLNQKGKQRARLQRKRCGAGPAPRLMGAFSGMALPSGALVGIGADCKTGLTSAEYWTAGTSRSSVTALPGPFKLFLPSGPYGSSITFHPHGESELYASYIEQVTDWELRPHIVHFDGKTWTDLACPATSEVVKTVVTKTGAVWVAADQYREEGWKVWRHPGAKAAGSWTDETPPEQSGFSGVAMTDLRMSPDGRLFIAAAHLVLEHGADGWTSHPLPRTRPSDETSKRYNARHLYWTSWGELVVEAWDGDVFALLRATKRHSPPVR